MVLREWRIRLRNSVTLEDELLLWASRHCRECFEAMAVTNPDPQWWDKSLAEIFRARAEVGGLAWIERAAVLYSREVRRLLPHIGKAAGVRLSAWWVDSMLVLNGAA